MINVKYQLRNLNYLIQDYSEYILKKHGEKTDNPSI